MTRKNCKLKKQQSHHGVILQGPEKGQGQKVKTTSVEEDEPNDEEQENLKKLKEKVNKKIIKQKEVTACKMSYSQGQSIFDY